jgi:hypothetical protein
MLILFFLLLTTPVLAADCTTSFDQSCLSGRYDAQAIESNHDQRQEEIKTFEQEQEEGSTQAAEAAEKQQRREAAPRREERARNDIITLRQGG